MPSCSRYPHPLLVWGLLCIAGQAAGLGQAPRLDLEPVSGYRVLHVFPHDSNAFTEGLVFSDGVLIEGTGLLGVSTLREVELASGRIVRQQAMAENHFGEGVTVLGDRIFQLTYLTGVCYVYDRATFHPRGTHTYAGEGWGLTHDGRHLIMSNGSEMLSFRDPDTFMEVRQIHVRGSLGAVRQLNELEYVNGEIWANVWKTSRIARIDPAHGKLLGWIELDGLLSPQENAQRVDVLNGIAYDPDTNRLFVTGKWWPKLFQIEVFP